MFNKIQDEVNDFSKNIKEEKGCEEMLTYLNSSFVSSVKLLMFASTIFSLYARIMLFFVIASSGLLMSSLIGAIPISSSFLLATTLVLFIVILIYFVQCKKMLTIAIRNARDKMQAS